MTDLRVLDEGPHHAVLDKPAGVVVVRARGVPGPTLLDLAEQRFGKGARPVHRLDRGTTGCLIVAKTPYGQQALSDAFRRHLTDKRYLALVEGAPSFERLDIDARLLRIDEPATKKGPLAWQTIDERGQRALTRVRVLARGEGVSLVEARPETGRMHQIRAHLSHVGHPLVGDPLYGAKVSAERPMLHAVAISFPAPGGGRRFITCPVPCDLGELARAAGIDVDKSVEPILKSFADRAKLEETPAKRPPAPPGKRRGTARTDKRGGPPRRRR